ncbi:uncharacterized protein LOC126891755 [Diabrotica virgifera virgifera]|uniref:Uncharacterized protein n=1 Tax=Diabrotica virgifera virgifera TaxID=50390 RepID=A0ABM5L3H6_DIAVI|nr:uncharacterized protein LOC126886927 [Diabrotica virgifera virgifera]XP_050517001.1 uncharacterized protein LOC126891755 [Diabrotica virgifera virgifera]
MKLQISIFLRMCIYLQIMSGKPLNSQSQQLVLNLCEYFEMEKINGGPLEPLSSVQERVAAALKISRKTISVIKKRKENNPVLPKPGKSRPRSKSKTTDLPEGTKITIRNTLYSMYEEKLTIFKHVKLGP